MLGTRPHRFLGGLLSLHEVTERASTMRHVMQLGLLACLLLV
jgi:hypothetical protein